MIRLHKKTTVIIILIMVAGFSAGFFIYNFFQNNGMRIGIIDSGIIFPSEKDEAKSFVKKEYGYDSDEEAFDILGHGSSIIETLKRDVGSIELKIYSGKIVSADRTITNRGIIAAMNWMLDQDIKVLLMSLGTQPVNGTDKDEVEEAAKQLTLEGIVIVAAVGNKGNPNYVNYDSGEFPAILPYVIGVGALDRIGLPAPYSSFGISYLGTNSVLLSAQGVNHLANQVGTSFAVPRIAAIIIKIIDYLTDKGEITPQGISAILSASTGNDYNDLSGFGLPDFETAIEMIDNGDPQLVFSFDENDTIDNFPTRFYNEYFTYKVYYDYFISDSVNASLNYNIKYSGKGDPIVSAKVFTNVLYNYIEYEVAIYNEPEIEKQNNLQILTQFNIGGNIFELNITHDFLGLFNKVFYYDIQGTDYLRTHEFGTFKTMDSILRNMSILPSYKDKFDDPLFRHENKFNDFLFRPYTVNNNYNDIFPWIEQGGIYIESYDYIDYMGSTDSALFDLFDIDLVDFGKVIVRSTVNYSSSIVDNINVMYHEGIGFLTNSTDFTTFLFLTENTDIKLGMMTKYGNGYILLLGSTRYFSNLGFWKSENTSLISNLNNIFNL